jgi:hypothetical protein
MKSVFHIINGMHKIKNTVIKLGSAAPTLQTDILELVVLFFRSAVTGISPVVEMLFFLLLGQTCLVLYLQVF